jgi:hypothetical protein
MKSFLKSLRQLFLVFRDGFLKCIQILNPLEPISTVPFAKLESLKELPVSLPVPIVPHHVNLEDCLHCEMILNRYKDFYGPLRGWFIEFRKNHPEAHVSCAGRGYLDQENAVIRKVSKAHYGESAHNYNCALDLFELKIGDTNIYDRAWFEKVLQPNLAPWMNWYGKIGSPYYELPHVEVTQWKALVKAGAVQLVEKFGEVVQLNG